MPSTNESNLGLSLGWTLGEDNWNTGMDANIAILGAMSNLSVKSRTTKVKPVSPADGDRYYIPPTATGVWADYKKNIAVYSAFHSDWFYIPIKYGMEFRIQNESNRLVFYNGTSLVSSTTGEEGWEFDPAASQTITGEWSFDISGGKSFIVSDDPTMASWDIMFGYSDHTMFNDSLTAGAYIEQASSGNLGASYVDVDDDGSVQIYHGTNNANGQTDDNTILAIDGSSTRSITVDELNINVDELNINSEVKVDVSGGKSFIISDDLTFASPVILHGIFDHHSINPTAIVLANTAGNIVGGNAYVNDVTLNDDGSISASCTFNDGVGVVSDVIELDGAGVASRTITVDELNINCPSGGLTVTTSGIGNITFYTSDNGKLVVEMAQVHSGYKSGTLASPPAGMVIGEVWADTTDSATHPIYRISTVTT